MQKNTDRSTSPFLEHVMSQWKGITCIQCVITDQVIMVMSLLLLRQDAEVCKFVVDSQAQWCHLCQRFPVRLQGHQNAMDKTTIKIVTLSTTKAEYVTTTHATKELIWFQCLITVMLAQLIYSLIFLIQNPLLVHSPSTQNFYPQLTTIKNANTK